MNIEQEIKELRNKLDKLEQQVNDKNKKWRYIPKYLQKYFFVLSEGTILEETCTSTSTDEFRISIGNCFETGEEAEKHKRILINTQKLKDLAFRLNDGEEINWNNKIQYKYYLCLYSNGDLNQNSNQYRKSQGIIYCLDDNFLEKAVEEIGEEELIELIKGE